MLGRMRFSKGKPNAPLGNYITKEEKEDKFNKEEDCLPGITPFTAHIGAFLGLGKLIREVGIIKDNALFTECIESIYKKLGLPADEIKSKMQNSYLSYQDVVQQGTSLIRKFVIKENGLQILAHHFDKQIK